VEVALDLGEMTIDRLTERRAAVHEDLLPYLQFMTIQLADELRTGCDELAADMGGSEVHLGELGLVAHMQRLVDPKSVHVELAGEF
jgi:hypothetical protein